MLYKVCKNLSEYATLSQRVTDLQRQYFTFTLPLVNTNSSAVCAHHDAKLREKAEAYKGLLIPTRSGSRNSNDNCGEEGDV
jgi:hypothetical protein